MLERGSTQTCLAGITAETVSGRSRTLGQCSGLPSVQLTNPNIAIPGIAAVVGDHQRVLLCRIRSQFVQVLELRDILTGLIRHRLAQRLRLEIRVEYLDAVEPVLHVTAVYQDASAVPLLYGQRRQFRRGCSEQVQRAGTVAWLHLSVRHAFVVDQLQLQ